LGFTGGGDGDEDGLDFPFAFLGFTGGGDGDEDGLDFPFAFLGFTGGGDGVDGFAFRVVLALTGSFFVGLLFAMFQKNKENRLLYYRNKKFKIQKINDDKQS
jgi:hypothetical protein